MKTRCRKCEFLNWDFLTKEYETGEWFCGLHGRASVDPDGEQQNLDHRGGCGFVQAKSTRQYQLF